MGMPGRLALDSVLRFRSNTLSENDPDLAPIAVPSGAPLRSLIRELDGPLRLRI